MSKLVAFAAIQGGYKVVSQAEGLYRNALDTYNADTKIGFPNTAYYLPVIYSLTGMKVETLEDLKKPLAFARGLLPPHVIESIMKLKKDILGARSLSLDLEETLIALAISAEANPTAQAAMEKLGELKNREMHMTHMPTQGDDAGLRKLGINCTSESRFSTKNLLDY